MEKVIEVKLRQILKEKGIGQKELAEKTGLTERTISELCNNKIRRYPKDALEKIVSTLNLTSMDTLMEIKEAASNK
ncbi:helix-turn-helix domain-containing protein [Rossellomorea marisflavi]|uniref:helix-turn-helix domain-containing protein n=1 Tax=Rossellomorea marisflavi TaxID=189381 RepID=UPI001317DB4B|nr:helix-turn-helix transcriptional regulator [Rossellomorea marisflavi]QHA36877.1 helix-turn-helix domain-containing protein [Rossellomorea marisflavi]